MESDYFSSAFSFGMKTKEDIVQKSHNITGLYMKIVDSTQKLDILEVTESLFE